VQALIPSGKTIRYKRDAILMCAQKPTRVSLIYRTENLPHGGKSTALTIH